MDMQPLVEIVQDTCGRHDTFGLSCTARYYEDLGYPGHVNCTDNINTEMERYGLAPRGGWPAINFFFNTLLDDANAIGMDDPWSRPGDYVLLQAQTDLVCVSTACPCDVDPANGWDPTDVQVRVYGEGEDFERSRGYRMTTARCPARRHQFPLDRRLGRIRSLDARTGRKARPRRLGAFLDRPASQHCVQGPKSRDIPREVIWTLSAQPALEELEWFRFTIGRIGDFHGPSVVVRRTAYTGELGYEIFCHPKDAAAVFDAVWQAGQPHGLTPFGFEALDMVRIESGLVFAGSEFCDQTDPFEAGIGFTVPLNYREGDFIGRAALERRKVSPERKLVGLDVEGNLVPLGGDCVRLGRAQVGEITSVVRSPVLGKVIALCRMDVAYADEGTEIEIGQLDGLQKRIPARVVRFPHFDSTKERVTGNYG